MISVEATISAPAGLFSGNPGGQALDFTGAMLRTVAPVFHEMVGRVVASTDNKSVAQGWEELPPQGSAGTVIFSAVNHNDAASVYEYGSDPHSIPQPPHWIPIQPLIEFYEQTRGMGPQEARQAAYGFQAWASENPFTIEHPGVQGHHNVEQTLDNFTPLLQEAAQQGFAEAVNARFA